MIFKGGRLKIWFGFDEILAVGIFGLFLPLPPLFPLVALVGWPCVVGVGLDELSKYLELGIGIGGGFNSALYLVRGSIVEKIEYFLLLIPIQFNTIQYKSNQFNEFDKLFG